MGKARFNRKAKVTLGKNSKNINSIKLAQYLKDFDPSEANWLDDPAVIHAMGERLKKGSSS